MPFNSNTSTPFAPVALSPADTSSLKSLQHDSLLTAGAGAAISGLAATSGLPATASLTSQTVIVFKPLPLELHQHQLPCIHPRAVIFDLDGTLLDTAPDIIGACNATLEHYGFAPLSMEQGLSKVTAGMRTLLRLGIPSEQQAQLDIDGEMRSYFAQYYLDHICEQTKPFTGMLELLDDLNQAGIKLAVVTNKYEDMTHKLLKNFAFYKDLQMILGCDSITNSKPHPEPILKTMEALKVEPYDTLYVGDHQNDIMAANRAKARSAVALWGYGPRECGDPKDWHAHYLLPDIAALRLLTLGE